MNKRFWFWLYETAMALLAIGTVVLAFRPQTTAVHLIFWITWGVFVADYVVRLWMAESKLRFMRDNLFDFVAILPWDFLRAARFVRMLRLLRLLRGLEVLWRVSATARGILRTNKLGHVMIGTTLLVVGGGLLIREVEPSIGSFADGVWWSLVTASTVGYGDIAPRTPLGRIIAAILMLIGIGTIGMITASIATYFLGAKGSENRHVQHVQKELDRWDELTPHQRHELAKVLVTLAEHGAEEAVSGELRE